MKIAIIGDLHFGRMQNNSEFLSKQLSYLREFQAYLLDNGINKVVQLGDTFDNRFSTNNYVLEEVRKNWFNWFNENRVTLISIMGNHDMFYKESVTHSPLFSFNSEYITIVDDILLETIDNRKYIYSSYNYDVSKLEDENIEDATLFSHIDVIGGKMNYNKNSDSGYNPKIFEKFYKVFSGHYHSASIIDNIVYQGSPYQLDFNNYNMQHSFRVLDTETREEIIVHNMTSPRFLEITYNGSKDITVAGLANRFVYHSDDPESAVEWIGDSYCKLIVKKIDNHIIFEKFRSKINLRDTINMYILNEHFSIENMDENEIKDSDTLISEYFEKLEYTEAHLTTEIMSKKYFKYHNQVLSDKSLYSMLLDKLDFKWITFKNFLSYGDKKTKIEFKNGLHRLVGKNGAGKTTGVIEAPNFLLFGNSMLNKNKSSLINVFTKKKLLVEGEFSVGEDLYKVTRGLKPKRFIIEKNGIELEKVAGDTNYQKIINDALGINQKQLQYLLLKNKKMYKPFSTLDTTEKRAFIEELFNLDVFTKVLDLIKEDLKENKKESELIWKDVEKSQGFVEQEEKHLDQIREVKSNQKDRDIKAIEEVMDDLHLNRELKLANEAVTDATQQLKELKDKNLDEIWSDKVDSIQSTIDTLRDNGKLHLNMINEKIENKEEKLELGTKNFKKWADEKIVDLNLELTRENSMLTEQKDALSEYELLEEPDYQEREKQMTTKDALKSKIVENATKVVEYQSTLNKMKDVCGDCVRVPELQKSYNMEELENEGIEAQKEVENIEAVIASFDKCSIIWEKSTQGKFLVNQNIERIEKAIKRIEEKIVDENKSLVITIQNFENETVELKAEIEEHKIEKVEYIAQVAVNIKEHKKSIEAANIQYSSDKADHNLKLDKAEKKVKEKNNLVVYVQEELEETKKKYLKAIKKLKKVDIEDSIDKTEFIRLEKDLRLDKERYEDIKLEVDYLDFLRKMLMSEDSIKSYVIEQYVDFINYEFNMNLSDFNVPFGLIFDKNLNQTFLGEYAELGYDNLSSGEEKSIDFAVIFTFDRLQEKLFGRKINAIIFDEILSGLDKDRMQIAFEKLKEKAQSKSVWIIEHVFEYDVDKTYIVTKDKFSKIREEL